MNNKLLILVDCQNDFVQGMHKCSGVTGKIIDNIVGKINEHNDIVIAALDTHFTLEQVNVGMPLSKQVKPFEYSLDAQMLQVPHCIKFTHGYEMQKNILEACRAKNMHSKKFYAIDKYSYGYDDWKTYLEKFDVGEIELCGFNLEYSILANAVILRSIYPNTDITIDLTCCAGCEQVLTQQACICMNELYINVVNNTL